MTRVGHTRGWFALAISIPVLTISAFVIRAQTNRDTARVINNLHSPSRTLSRALHDSIKRAFIESSFCKTYLCRADQPGQLPDRQWVSWIDLRKAGGVVVQLHSDSAGIHSVELAILNGEWRNDRPSISRGDSAIALNLIVSVTGATCGIAAPFAALLARDPQRSEADAPYHLCGGWAVQYGRGTPQLRVIPAEIARLEVKDGPNR